VFSSIGIKSRLTKIFFLYKKSKKDWENASIFFKKTKIIIRENHAGQDCGGGFQNFFASIAAVILWHGKSSHTQKKRKTQDNVFTK
jgi:hypothetical protein